MKTRRRFLKGTLQTSLGLAIPSVLGASCQSINEQKDSKPIVLSTWNNIQANDTAWAVIDQKGSALDAVEAGVKIPEANPDDRSVGLGGRPDRDGHVTLDACIMNHLGDAGSVTFLEHIKHPISVARAVMEKTPHVILSGQGALAFAEANGFKRTNLLTDQSKKDWEKWKKEEKYKPIINIENHDTIGMLALDHQGNLSGACTTSGLAYKLRGRVGDSPIIGAGLYVDNEVGGATATGMGEFVIKTVGSFLVVELMRQGKSPDEACKEAVMRLVAKHNVDDIQVGYIAMNKRGEVGGFSLRKGFMYAISDEKGTRTEDSKYHIA